MDIVLLVANVGNAAPIDMVRGKKSFVKKILEQVFGLSKIELEMLFSTGEFEKNTKQFFIHENFNSLHQDIQSLEAILVLLRDVERFQTGEHVQILRDAAIRIEKTLQNICQNFSK
jgi:hypothetical protein